MGFQTPGIAAVLTNNLTITFTGTVLIGIATFLSRPVMTRAMLSRELSSESYPTMLSIFSTEIIWGMSIILLANGLFIVLLQSV